MRRRRDILRAINALVLIPAALSACSSGGGADADDRGGGTAETSFHDDVAPILQKSCVGCHSPGNIAPFSLTTYESAKTVAASIAAAARARTMPPWGALDTDECAPRFGWKNDLRLTEAEIATLESWAAAGAPEGEPTAPLSEPPRTDGLPEADVDIAPSQPFVSSGDADQFRCFVLDPKLTEAKYLNGTHVVPGNPKVVHHAVVYLDVNGESAALADESGSYDCFGGPGFGGPLVTAWAPGGVPTVLPSNVGSEIPAGSRFVMQVHYHPAGATADPDATRLQLRFSSARPEYKAFVSFVGNFDGPNQFGGLLPGEDDVNGVEFRIPANARAHVESMEFKLPKRLPNAPRDLPELYVYGVSTHMHYIGTDMRIELAHAASTVGEPANECLLQTPRWNFAWQRGYEYDAPIEELSRFLAGDTIKLRCTYDNSTDNPHLMKALAEGHQASPRDVHLGESTLDEMCLSTVTLLMKNP